jgi:hypothetical protein
MEINLIFLVTCRLGLKSFERASHDMLTMTCFKSFSLRRDFEHVNFAVF